MTQREITLAGIAFAIFVSGFSLGLRLGLTSMLNSAKKAGVVVYNQESKKFEWVKQMEIDK